MTPNQARAARAMLNFDMKSVCKLTTVGKRTLTEFESGRRSIGDVTMSKLKAFYISRGIDFGGPLDFGEAVSLKNLNILSLENSDVVTQKVEHLDFLEINAIADGLDSIIAVLNTLQQRLHFSQKIILHTMEKLGLNQKQLAAVLGCSPAFVNAIVVGKKFIPLAMADFIYNLDGEFLFDLRNCVVCEKKFYAKINEMRESGVYAKNILATI